MLFVVFVIFVVFGVVVLVAGVLGLDGFDFPGKNAIAIIAPITSKIKIICNKTYLSLKKLFPK